MDDILKEIKEKYVSTRQAVLYMLNENYPIHKHSDQREGTWYTLCWDNVYTDPFNLCVKIAIAEYPDYLTKIEYAGKCIYMYNGKQILVNEAEIIEEFKDLAVFPGEQNKWK